MQPRSPTLTLSLYPPSYTLFHIYQIVRFAYISPPQSMQANVAAVNR